MIAKAKLRFVRISPRKAKEVIDTVRGKTAQEAIAVLTSLNKKAAPMVLKLLKSALSNAGDAASGLESVYISRITADGGPSFKRYRAEPFGRASVIRKRTSHIEIELDNIKAVKPETKKKTTAGKKKIQKNKPAKKKKTAKAGKPKAKTKGE